MFGARVTLADCGSSYSPLFYRADLRPNFVKLDQVLLRGAHHDRVQATVIQAATDAADELDEPVAVEVEPADRAGSGPTVLPRTRVRLCYTQTKPPANHATSAVRRIEDRLSWP